MKLTVDRIENDIAVLLIRPEEKEELQIPIRYLPEEVEEGDILKVDFTIDGEETKAAEKRVGNLINKLKNKDNTKK
ncbi:MAG: DUF3006 domain-containing protein [Bacillota bacterium]